MLNYSETSENVYLAFNHHIRLKNKKFNNLVHLTFKRNMSLVVQGLTLFSRLFYNIRFAMQTRSKKTVPEM